MKNAFCPAVLHGRINCESSEFHSFCNTAPLLIDIIKSLLLFMLNNLHNFRYAAEYAELVKSSGGSIHHNSVQLFQRIFQCAVVALNCQQR